MSGRTLLYALGCRVVSKKAERTELDTAFVGIQSPVVFRASADTSVSRFVWKSTGLAWGCAGFWHFIAVREPVAAIDFALSGPVVCEIPARTFCDASIRCVISKRTQWQGTLHHTNIEVFFCKHWRRGWTLGNTCAVVLIRISSLRTVFGACIQRIRTEVCFRTVCDTLESCGIFPWPSWTRWNTCACSVVSVSALNRTVCHTLKTQWVMWWSRTEQKTWSIEFKCKSVGGTACYTFSCVHVMPFSTWTSTDAFSAIWSWCKSQRIRSAYLHTTSWSIVGKVRINTRTWARIVSRVFVESCCTIWLTRVVSSVDDKACWTAGLTESSHRVCISACGTNIDTFLPSSISKVAIAFRHTCPWLEVCVSIVGTGENRDTFSIDVVHKQSVRTNVNTKLVVNVRVGGTCWDAFHRVVTGISVGGTVCRLNTSFDRKVSVQGNIDDRMFRTLFDT